MRWLNASEVMYILAWICLVYAATMLGGCRGPIQSQVAVRLAPGESEVVWVAAGKRLYRCVDTSSGPVCSLARMPGKGRRR